MPGSFIRAREGNLVEIRLSNHSHAETIMETNEMTIDPRWSINRTVTTYPETLSVLSEFKVDTCRGGAETLTSAARIAGVEIKTLLDALADAVSAPASSEQLPPAAPTCGCCSTRK